MAVPADQQHTTADGDGAAEFERHRPMLLGLAYRFLGSMWDAEDVVQDACVRWLGTDREEVRVPRAFLVKMVSRLALDQLRSARVTREAYTGPWLPEPVATGALGPMDTAELRDTVAFATVHLMERLTPPERAVFVLREAFELPYDEIADILGASVPHCRQLLRRAGQHLADGRERFTPAEEDHVKLFTRFLEAAQEGDLGALTDLLSEDVVAWNDGGGRVRAALRPVIGRAKVLAFITGLLSRYATGATRLVDVNGAPALSTSMHDRSQITMLDVRDGRVHGIYAVLNPDKLGHVPA
ncbi:RNA polymerase sigma factor SigJ [Streptomyces sp. TLI_146]|uniref:RNA polymerase sigma factor SigJ n=1 Tax=Streptomyces sp. TLI_146 TaxID=1938858 RepID=UPI000C7136DC|nr:RNA polymerase sigma factor SigJ [Streptomyces sp. TLI_146]PKV83979.1 RNA polymerase ECF family sigma subunit [Streptomyces sp. TLI_146]